MDDDTRFHNSYVAYILEQLFYMYAKKKYHFLGTCATLLSATLSEAM